MVHYSLHLTYRASHRSTQSKNEKGRVCVITGLWNYLNGEKDKAQKGDAAISETPHPHANSNKRTNRNERSAAVN